MGPIVHRTLRITLQIGPRVKQNRQRDNPLYMKNTISQSLRVAPEAHHAGNGFTESDQELLNSILHYTDIII